MPDKSRTRPSDDRTLERVLWAVRTIGRGARTSEIVAVARCPASAAADVLCELEAQGLVAVWSWEPVRAAEEASR